MNNNAEDAILKKFTNYLKVNKMRCTPERYAILRAIYSMNGSFNVDMLLKHMEENEKFRVSKATVYNTLSLLSDADFVMRQQLGKTTRYEKFNGRKARLICTCCHKVIDVNNLDLTETLTNNIKKFHLTHYSLSAYGLCARCHNAARRRKLKENNIKK